MANKDCNTESAVAYVRKSTAGQDSDGHERQAKSIDQQRREITELAKLNGYKIVRWYSDEGVSGWKRNGNRPGFDRMLADAKAKHDFQTIICDDLDRFSRAEVMEVFADLSTLAAAGVKIIHCVNQGQYALGENDIGKIIKLVVDVHGGNEYSRKHGRRIALARRNRAAEGKWSGGQVPYGMKSVGSKDNYKLVLGDPAKMKVVCSIFEMFVAKRMTLNGIARRLNEQGTPPPKGGTWFTMTVKKFLMQRAYRGDFTFGKISSGRFWGIDENGEVIEASKIEKKQRTTAAIVKQDLYEPLIIPSLWDRAQKRLASFNNGKHKPKFGGSPLSGILVCDHCGRSMYRVASAKVYRCSTNAKAGVGSCGYYEIPEAEILPIVLRTLDEEIDALTARSLVPDPPEPEPMADYSDEIAALDAKIANGEDRIFDIGDLRTRQSLDKKITAWRDERDALIAKADAPADDQTDYAAQLAEWWTAFQQRLVPVSIDAASNIAQSMFPEMAVEAAKPAPWNDWMTQVLGRKPSTVFFAELDCQAINDALHALGTEVRLRWRTVRNGHRKHHLEKGRFRLGQRIGELSCSVNNDPPT